MDTEKREKLIEKIKEQGLPLTDRPLGLVSVEDFFTGNDDVGSIGCNLSCHPGVEFFVCVFESIRTKDPVQDVLVEVNEVVEDDHTWPFSDTVYILTRASIEDVRSWVAPLQPDDISEGWAHGVPPGAPRLLKGVRVYAVWWD